MADNVPISAGTGTSIRCLSDGTNEWPAGVVAYATTINAGANVLQIVDATHGLPVSATLADAAPAGVGAITAADVANGSPVAGPSGQLIYVVTPTANSTIVWTVAGASSYRLQVTGTFALTYSIEKSADGGATWTGTGGFLAGTSVTGGAGLTTPAIFEGNLAGCNRLRLRCTAFTSNTSLVAALATSPTAGAVKVENAAVVGTAGGCLSSSFLSTAAVQSTAVKASAGQVYSVQLFNVGAAAVYVRLYNQATAPASTDGANILWRGFVPGNTTGAGISITFPGGLAFSAGIGMRVTGAVADNDATVLAANTVGGNVIYK